MSIALLGTGLRGSAIGQRLLEQGHPLTVWNRSPQRSEALALFQREAEASGLNSSGLDSQDDCALHALTAGRATAAALR